MRGKAPASNGVAARGARHRPGGISGSRGCAVKGEPHRPLCSAPPGACPARSAAPTSSRPPASRRHERLLVTPLWRFLTGAVRTRTALPPYSGRRTARAATPAPTAARPPRRRPCGRRARCRGAGHGRPGRRGRPCRTATGLRPDDHPDRPRAPPPSVSSPLHGGRRRPPPVVRGSEEGLRGTPAGHRCVRRRSGSPCATARSAPRCRPLSAIPPDRRSGRIPTAPGAPGGAS